MDNGAEAEMRQNGLLASFSLTCFPCCCCLLVLFESVGHYPRAESPQSSTMATFFQSVYVSLRNYSV